MLPSESVTETGGSGVSRGQAIDARKTAMPLRGCEVELKTTSARDVSGFSVPVLMRSAMAWKSAWKNT